SVPGRVGQQTLAAGRAEEQVRFHLLGGGHRAVARGASQEDHQYDLDPGKGERERWSGAAFAAPAAFLMPGQATYTPNASETEARITLRPRSWAVNHLASTGP